MTMKADSFMCGVVFPLFRTKKNLIQGMMDEIVWGCDAVIKLG